MKGSTTRQRVLQQVALAKAPPSAGPDGLAIAPSQSLNGVPYVFKNVASRQERHVPHEAWHVVRRQEESERFSKMDSREFLPVQRMVYDGTTSSLYVSTTWSDQSSAEGKPVSDTLNSAKNKFVTVIANRIKDPYGIESHSATIVTDSAAMVGQQADKLLDDEDTRLELLEEKWADKNKNIQSKESKQKSFMDKMSHATRKRQTSALNNLGCGPAKLKADLTKIVNQNFYLLKLNDIEISGKELINPFSALMAKAKPVLLPQDYMEDDTDSDVDFTLGGQQTLSNPQKTKVCNLISMVYQKAISGTTAQLAKQKISSLLQQFGINLLPSSIQPDNLQAGKYLPNNTNLYDTIIARLHRTLQPQGTFYDLDRFSEKTLEKAGYRCIVSCNCSYKDLPANIPPHLTLTKGSAYIFHIKGHAQAVLVKKDIHGAMGSLTPPTLAAHKDYFTAFNETSKNYNQDPWSQNITSIWQE